MNRIVSQDPQRTVGDTFTVVHRVAVPAGSVVQARVPTDSMLVTVLGAPVVSREGDSVRIAYSLAVWAPGNNELVIPGAIVVSGTGRIDTLPDARVMLDVASVLPRDSAATAIAPRALRPWIARGDVTWVPLVIIVPVVAALAVAGAWWRRRRGPEPVAPLRLAETPAVDVARLERWLDSGEARVVLDHLEAALAGRSAAAAWHEAVHAVRFAPADVAELDRLGREGLRLLAGPGE